jgi:hypothetical protein
MYAAECSAIDTPALSRAVVPAAERSAVPVQACKPIRNTSQPDRRIIRRRGWVTGSHECGNGTFVAIDLAAQTAATLR